MGATGSEGPNASASRIHEVGMSFQRDAGGPVLRDGRVCEMQSGDGVQREGRRGGAQLQKGEGEDPVASNFL